MGFDSFTYITHSSEDSCERVMPSRWDCSLLAAYQENVKHHLSSSVYAKLDDSRLPVKGSEIFVLHYHISPALKKKLILRKNSFHQIVA